MPRWIVCAACMGIVSAACGGKILDDPDASSAAPAPVAAEPAATTSTISIDEACERICDRDGRCGAWTANCVPRCLATARGGCGGDAWLRCYGEQLQDCDVLPPACEPAYCAWAACGGRPLPPYCH